MRKGNLKNTGRILACGALLFLCAPLLRAAQLETEIDDAAIGVGDTTSIRVKLAGDPGDLKMIKYPSVPGLKFEYTGMEHSFEYINGKSWSGVKLIFMVTALKKGRYRIPPFVFQRSGRKLQTREVELSVSAVGSDASAGDEGSRGEADIRSSVDLSSGSAYVGQPVIMRYYLMTSGFNATPQRLNEYPETKGFVIKMIDDPAHAGQGIREGAYEKTHIVTFALIPAGGGSYRVGGGSATISVESPVRRRRDDFFGGFNFPGFARPQVLSFETKPLTIMPLPVQGRPDRYQGDIGSFTMKAEIGSDPVKVYEEKKITVTIEGAGNLVTMTKPYLEKEVPGLKVISEEGGSVINVEGGTLRGSKKFIFTLVPEKAGDINPGRIRFSFFNPDAGRYETLETKEIAFTAKGDGGKRESRYDDEGKEKKLDLNPLYFVLIVIAVAGTIVFVVMWERRRYQMVANGTGMEQKPEEYPDRRDDQDYAADAARFAERGDGDGFLKAAEKAIDQILKTDSTAGRDDAAGRIREQIYGYKFGRGSIAADDMKRILAEIGKLKS